VRSANETFSAATQHTTAQSRGTTAVIDRQRVRQDVCFFVCLLTNTKLQRYNTACTIVTSFYKVLLFKFTAGNTCIKYVLHDLLYLLQKYIILNHIVFRM